MPKIRKTCHKEKKIQWSKPTKTAKNVRISNQEHRNNDSNYAP